MNLSPPRSNSRQPNTSKLLSHFVSEDPFRLVGPEEVSEVLQNLELGREVILLEAHFSSVDHPLDPERPPFRHLPGAIQIHPSYLEAGMNRAKYYPFYEHPTEANILSCRDLAMALERLGLRPQSCVVVYGSDPDGMMAAARLVWGLMHAGVESVWLMDGGLDAWVAHGGATELTIRSVWDIDRGERDGPHFDWTMRSNYLATTAEVSRIVASESKPASKLIDVRTVEEWEGRSDKKYPFFSATGHIPQAIHQGNWDNLMDGSSRSLAKHLDVVARRWHRQGIIDEGAQRGETALIFYCGTGWRSSIAFLVAHLLGLRAKNYDDGFYGWSHHSAMQCSSVEITSSLTMELPAASNGVPKLSS